MFTNLGVETYTKEKVKVFVNAKKGTIMVVNMSNPGEEYCSREIRGLGPVGYPCNIFSKREEKKTYDEAYFNYLEMHPNLTEEEKNEAHKRINTNLNNSVLRALEDYDFVEVGTLGKYGDYIEAMLKPIEPKEGESKSQFSKREKEARNNELRKAGISITYILDSKMFNKKVNIIDNMKIEKEAKKYNNYARIEKNNRVYGRKNMEIRLRREEISVPQNIIIAMPEVV